MDLDAIGRSSVVSVSAAVGTAQASTRTDARARVAARITALRQQREQVIRHRDKPDREAHANAKHSKASSRRNTSLLRLRRRACAELRADHAAQREDEAEQHIHLPVVTACISVAPSMVIRICSMEVPTTTAVGTRKM